MLKYTEWKKNMHGPEALECSGPEVGSGPSGELDVKQRSKGKKGKRENLGSNPGPLG